MNPQPCGVHGHSGWFALVCSSGWPGPDVPLRLSLSGRPDALFSFSFGPSPSPPPSSVRGPSDPESPLRLVSENSLRF